MTETRQWVRLVDDQLVLTWQTHLGGDQWKPGGTRPLTRRERLAWYWLKRTPKPQSSSHAG